MIKNLLVTGASRGIGAAIVRNHLETRSEGTIITVARPSPAFDALISEMRAKHAECRIVQIHADMGDHDQLLQLIAELEEQGLAVDGLVNNAGYTNPRSINETTVEDFLLTLKVNLLAPFMLVQSLIKRDHPLKLVVNIASTAGISGRPGWVSYSASKAALINMSEVMRQELKPYGTRVICLSPGRCATDLRRILAPDEDPSTIMQPEQVAEIVNLMCSDIGQLIDSQNVVVRT